MVISPEPKYLRVYGKRKRVLSPAFSRSPLSVLHNYHDDRSQTAFLDTAGSNIASNSPSSLLEHIRSEPSERPLAKKRRPRRSIGGICEELCSKQILEKTSKVSFQPYNVLFLTSVASKLFILILLFYFVVFSGCRL